MRSESFRRTRVHVVATTQLFRQGLAGALRDDAIVEGSGPTLPTHAEIKEHGIDLLLADAGATPSDAIAALHAQVPGLAIVLVGMSRENVAQYAEAGAVGFVPSDALVDELLERVDEVTRHGASCPAALLAVVLRHVAQSASRRSELDARLTAREAEVVVLVGQGRSNKEIAHALGIELPTVKNHIHNILEKLQLESRTDVALLARTGEI